jgi:hypothetical protein
MISHYITQYESYLSFCRYLYAISYVWDKQLGEFVAIKITVYQRRYRAFTFLGRFQLLVMIAATMLAASGHRDESLVNVVSSTGITLFYFVTISLRGIHFKREKAEDVVFLLNSIIRCEESFPPATQTGNLRYDYYYLVDPVSCSQKNPIIWSILLRSFSFTLAAFILTTSFLSGVLVSIYEVVPTLLAINSFITASLNPSKSSISKFRQLQILIAIHNNICSFLFYVSAHGVSNAIVILGGYLVIRLHSQFIFIVVVVTSTSTGIVYILIAIDWIVANKTNSESIKLISKLKTSCYSIMKKNPAERRIVHSCPSLKVKIGSVRFTTELLNFVQTYN